MDLQNLTRDEEFLVRNNPEKYNVMSHFEIAELLDTTRHSVEAISNDVYLNNVFKVLGVESFDKKEVERLKGIDISALLYFKGKELRDIEHNKWINKKI